MLADMAMELDAARLLIWRAAELKNRGVRHSSESAMAKLYGWSSENSLDRSPSFNDLGAEKRSVTLDLRLPKARELAQRLAAAPGKRLAQHREDRRAVAFDHPADSGERTARARCSDREVEREGSRETHRSRAGHDDGDRHGRVHSRSLGRCGFGR